MQTRLVLVLTPHSNAHTNGRLVQNTSKYAHHAKRRTRKPIMRFCGYLILVLCVMCCLYIMLAIYSSIADKVSYSAFSQHTTHRTTIAIGVLNSYVF